MDTSLRLSWTPVDSDSVAYYIIQYRLSGSQSWEEANEVNVSTDTSDNMITHELTGLLPYMTYDVRVLAVSSTGLTSVPSEPQTITTKGEAIQWVFVKCSLLELLGLV